MDLFGRKARAENMRLYKELISCKDTMKRAKELIQMQENKIFKLEQEIKFLKMCETLDFPNTRKEQ